MIETHESPDDAWSDAAQQITLERLLEILKDLEIRLAVGKDAQFNNHIELLRNQIDDIDPNLLDHLSQRLKVVQSIGSLKKAHNVAVYQAERLTQMKVNALRIGVELGLSQTFVEKFLQLIHQESVIKQNKIMIH